MSFFLTLRRLSFTYFSGIHIISFVLTKLLFKFVNVICIYLDKIIIRFTGNLAWLPFI
jgi:hypothetical protein